VQPAALGGTRQVPKNGSMGSKTKRMKKPLVRDRYAWMILRNDCDRDRQTFQLRRARLNESSASTPGGGREHRRRLAFLTPTCDWRLPGP
jgi:hypothetical protein